MKVTIPYEYTEEIVPKHCRIPRPVRFNSLMLISLHEVSSKDAPIAILEHDEKFDDKTNQYKPNTTVYRWWNKRLWILDIFNRYSHGDYETQTAEQFTKDPYPMTNGTPYYWAYDTKQKQRHNLITWASGILFIDGTRWKQANEPRYVIMTFGLGHNHAGIGTSLSTDNNYNSNISNSRYFRIDQYQQARESAIATALRRGDNESIPFINKSTIFEILIPEAVRLNPNKEHGQGDPFINSMENLIEISPDRATAGLLIMTKTLQEVK